MGTRPCLHGHHGRDAADFGPVPGARSAVDWTSTSDERHGNRPKAARPFGLRRKSPSGSSKHSTVLPDTLFALLLPKDDFRTQRGSRGLCKQGLVPHIKRVPIPFATGPVPPVEIFFLVAVGFLAGTSNALVGGGTLFTFPVLLAAGLPPVIANTTTTIALVPGTFTSAYAYLPGLRRVRERFPQRIAVAIAGGLTG